MGQVQMSIESKLAEALNPHFMEIVNQSHTHCNSENQETHFKITAVSDAFSNLNAVKRHQLIYSLLAEEMSAGLHALALHLYTPAQWEARGETVPASSKCVGHR